MQPNRRYSRATCRRSILTVCQGGRDRSAALALTTRADVVAALERPPTLRYEVSFVVIDAFVHEEFALVHRSARTRDEAVNEISSVARSPELKLIFIGLTSGDILYFQHDLVGPPQRSLSVEKLREHTGAVHCLQFVQSTQQDAFRGLPTGDSTADDLGNPDPWLLSGSADRTIKIWSICGKNVECIRTLGGHGGTVVSLCLCMPYLFSSSTDGALFFWNVNVSRKGSPTFTLLQKMQAGVGSACPSTLVRKQPAAN